MNKENHCFLSLLYQRFDCTKKVPRSFYICSFQDGTRFHDFRLHAVFFFFGTAKLSTQFLNARITQTYFFTISVGTIMTTLEADGKELWFQLWAFGLIETFTPFQWGLRPVCMTPSLKWSNRGTPFFVCFPLDRYPHGSLLWIRLF